MSLAAPEVREWLGESSLFLVMDDLKGVGQAAPPHCAFQLVSFLTPSECEFLASKVSVFICQLKTMPKSNRLLEPSSVWGSPQVIFVCEKKS